MSSGVWFPTLGLVAWLCCLSLGPVQGGKVLVHPVDGSHWLSMKILVKELARRGHEVLVLVPESSLLMKGSESYKTEFYKVPYTKAELDATFEDLKESVFLEPPRITDLFVNVQRLVTFTSMQVTGCESLLNNKATISRLRKEGFDLVLTDPFLPCGSILAHLFSIPVVYFLHGLPCELDAKANQCPVPVSYVPVSFSGNSPTMTFPQRVKNMAMSLLEGYLCKVMYSSFDDLTRSQFGDDMTYKRLLGEAAFWLHRHDFVFDWPKPVMPNTALIGGINCAKKAPLPAVSISRMYVNIWIHLRQMTYPLLCVETS